jgi:ubiquinone/menaquinone biosynthesis C-methylase UbiE
VEIGCGYGTFTLPAANRISGTVHAFDLEESMISHAGKRSREQNIINVKFYKRDVLEETTGLPENSADMVFLFNIMHHERPLDFVREAYRILRSGGKLCIIHWRSDIPTPRGPDVNTRPKPESVNQWLDLSLFDVTKGPFILEPWHFGLVATKKP